MIGDRYRSYTAASVRALQPKLIRQSRFPSPIPAGGICGWAEADAGSTHDISAPFKHHCMPKPMVPRDPAYTPFITCVA
jgi:hypothetical protein